MSLISAFHREAIRRLSVSQPAADNSRSLALALSLFIPLFFFSFLPTSSLPFSFHYTLPLFLFCLLPFPSCLLFLFSPLYLSLMTSTCTSGLTPSLCGRKERNEVGNVDSSHSQLHFLILRPVCIRDTQEKLTRNFLACN